MANFTVYGKHNCPFCTIAKETLEKLGHSYEFKNTANDDNFNELLIRYPDVRTVPQVWLGDLHIGGSDHLTEYFKNN